MIRAVVTITGEVQEAGYRAFVIRVARKLGLVGNIENIPDGTVRVICEGEKENIEKFVERIRIKTETIVVEGIEIKYENATGEFAGKGFDIKVEESFKGVIREMFQGYATAEKYFEVGWDKQDKTLGAIKDMHQDIKGFRKETKNEFSTIKTDYGKISQELTKAIQGIETVAKNTGKLLERSEADRKDFRDAIERLAKAIESRK